MEVYHQTGFRWKWNLESFSEDSIGSGLIFSPVNIKPDKLSELPGEIKEQSFFDPQIYLPKQLKGSLEEYDYFPTKLRKEFRTEDFEAVKDQIAEFCINLQLENNFKYVVIPTRYLEDPSDYYEQNMDYFIAPFLEYYYCVYPNRVLLLKMRLAICLAWQLVLR